MRDVACRVACMVDLWGVHKFAKARFLTLPAAVSDGQFGQVEPTKRHLRGPERFFYDRSLCELVWKVTTLGFEALSSGKVSTTVGVITSAHQVWLHGMRSIRRSLHYRQGEKPHPDWACHRFDTPLH
eukprot:6462358-Amphidinium_carterae.1